MRLVDTQDEMRRDKMRIDEIDKKDRLLDRRDRLNRIDGMDRRDRIGSESKIDRQLDR